MQWGMRLESCADPLIAGNLPPLSLAKSSKESFSLATDNAEKSRVLLI
jgi:hypothetical protein